MAIPLRIYAYLAGFLAVLGLAWTVYHRVDSGGYDRCKDEQQLATAQAERQDHANYVSAVAWGSQVSADLAAKQIEAANLRSENARLSAQLVGTCPLGLRYIADAAATQTHVPNPSGKPFNPPGTVAADIIASNVTDNYARGNDCIRQLNALIDWHEKYQK